MATVTSLTTTITAPVNFVLMRGLLRAAERVMPFYNGVVQSTLESMKGSLSVKWRRLENLAVATTALTELAGNQTAYFLGRTSATPTFTDITATAQKYGNFITYTEELDIGNVNSKSMDLMDKLGENAGHSLNVLQSQIFDNASLIRFANSVADNSAIGAAMVLADVRASVNTLNRNSARKFFPMGEGSVKIGTNVIRESYMGICHTDVEEDIRDMTGFVAVEAYASHVPVLVGEFGHVNGVRWASTPIANISTGAGGASANGLRGANVGTHDVYDSFIYGRDSVGAVGLGTKHATEIYRATDQNPARVPAVIAINHPPGSSGSADPFDELGTVAWKAWHTGAILDSDWIVMLRTAATDFAI